MGLCTSPAASGPGSAVPWHSCRELVTQHCAPRTFQMLECTDLGNELDCVVSLFATYLRSQCLGMQSLVLRAILGLTERPDTVSRGSRQHHECGGLGWAGPGLLWLGTFPGSGEGAAGGRRRASIPAPPALFLWGCAGQPCRPAPRCPMGRSQREGWDRRVFSPRWQALLYPKEGVFFTQARQTLVLLPSITEQLQGADSDTRTVALPVLSTMLRLLEGRTLSLTALELAGKLPSLFDDVRLRPHVCVPVTPHCGLSLPGSQPWALRALGQTFGRPQLAHFGSLLGAVLKVCPLPLGSETLPPLCRSCWPCLRRAWSHRD